MFRNYFKIAWRSFLRNKSFSAINILGLSIGIAVCFIILLFVQDELSYDRFHAKANDIYRIEFNASINNGKINEANVMPPVARTLQKDYPEVQEVTRIRTMGDPHIWVNEKQYDGNSLAYVDSNFFNVFSISLLQGNAKTALLAPPLARYFKSGSACLFWQREPVRQADQIIKEQRRSAIHGYRGV